MPDPLLPGQVMPGSSCSSEGPTVYQQVPMPQPYTSIPPTFQPYPRQDQPVIPPVVLDNGMLLPTFLPVVPQPMPQRTVFVNSGISYPQHPGSENIPLDGYG